MGPRKKPRVDNVVSNGSDNVKPVLTTKYFQVDEQGTHASVYVTQQEYPANPVPDPPSVAMDGTMKVSVNRFVNPIYIGSYENEEAEITTEVNKIAERYSNPGHALSREDIDEIRETLVANGLVPYNLRQAV